MFRQMFRRIATPLFFFFSLISGAALATPPGATGTHKIKICHATASATNPYNIIEVDVAAWSANPGLDSRGKPIKQSNHWGHQTEFGGKGDFWLEDETMTCAGFAQWLDDSGRSLDYLAQGRSIYVLCDIPQVTSFVDPTDGHIISVPCPGSHTIILAPSDTVLLSGENDIEYFVTSVSGQMPATGFHTKYHPSPGTTSPVVLDASGGNFAVLCPAGGSLDVKYAFEYAGEVFQGIYEMPCTVGQSVTKGALYMPEGRHLPLLLCPDEGFLRVCFTGHSAPFETPVELTSTHACYDDYACVAAEAVDVSRFEVSNSGFFEFPGAYYP